MVPLETAAPLSEVDVNMDAAKTSDGNSGADRDHAKEADAVIQQEMANMPLKEGQVQYLINASWWKRWIAHVGMVEEDGKLKTLEDSASAGDTPGPISNDELLKADDHHTDLIEGLREGEHFKILSEGSWKYLSDLYGGGPAIPRKVVSESSGVRVDVYPFILKVFKFQEQDRAKTLQIPKQAKVSELKAAACALWGAKAEDVELLDWYNNAVHCSLEGREKADKALKDVSILDNQYILLGMEGDGQISPGGIRRDENGSAAAPTSGGMGSPLTRTPFRLNLLQDSVTEGRSVVRGLAGLGNLGNTCFMNSSLQCLSHAAPLVRMFLSGAYRQDINKDNPLGNRGELAEAFGMLLKLLWQGGVSFVTPRAFKQTVGACAPQFSGYQQHDSQELLAFLLDGLHEDLNRVRQKPYIEEADAGGRPDKVVAQEVWENYQKRNDSVIVDHFQGMYKSKLVCPQCSFVGVKFDPYMYLSLNLPESKSRTLQVTAVYVDGAQPPMQHAVDVPKTGTIGQVYEAIARELHLPAEQKPMELLLLIELMAHRAPTRFTDADAPVSQIKERPQLLVYRYASRASGPQSDGKETHLFHRRRHPRKRGVSDKEQPLSDLFAAPLVLFMPEGDVKALELRQQHLDQWASNIWVQQPNALDEALLSALRPFKKARVQQNGNGHAAVHTGQTGANARAQGPRSFFSSNSVPGEHARSSADRADGVASGGADAGRPAQSSATPFGLQSEWPAFGLGLSAPPQSPQSRPASPVSPEHASSGGAASDCASIQAQNEFDQPFSDEDETGPHNKSQRLRGASQQSLTGLVEADANGAEPMHQSASTRDTNMAAWSGWDQPGTPAGAPWVQDNDDLQWENTDDAENAAPGSEAFLITASADAGKTVRNGSMHLHVTPQQSPQDSPERSAQPLDAPLGLSNTGSRTQPFDMFAAQRPSAEQPQRKDEEDVQAVSSVPHAQYPWQLKCCSQNGETKLYHMPEQDSASLYFAVEWAPESVAQYDVSSLEWPPQAESARAAQQREEERRQSAFSLQQCLESFVQPEKLDSAEAWYCPRCKEHVQASKKLDLWTTPEVLILHLKRFQYTTQSRRKIDAPITFPLTGLDLLPYLIKQQDVPPVYDLFAISQHYGSLGGGHYTATCRAEDGDWYSFNDSSVDRLDAMDPQDSARSAYVLFYRRQQDWRHSPSCLPPAAEAGAGAEVARGQEDREMEDAEESVDISIVGSPHADRAASSSILGEVAAANGNGFLRGYEHVPAVPCTAQEGAVQDVVVSDDTSADGVLPPLKGEAPDIQSTHTLPGSPLLHSSDPGHGPAAEHWPAFSP